MEDMWDIFFGGRERSWCCISSAIFPDEESPNILHDIRPSLERDALENDDRRIEDVIEIGEAEIVVPIVLELVIVVAIKRRVVAKLRIIIRLAFCFCAVAERFYGTICQSDRQGKLGGVVADQIVYRDVAAETAFLVRTVDDICFVRNYVLT